MYRFNITFVVEPAVQERWLDLVRGKFVPALRGGGYGRVALSRVLSAQAEDHFTWSLLVELDSMEKYHDITGGLWQDYLDLAGPLFGDGVVWFMSLMKEVEC